MRRLVVTLAIISTCLGAVAQGKIILCNDSLHLIYEGGFTPIPQIGGWTALTMQLWGGTSALSLTLQTTIVGDAIGNAALPDGRIASRNITLVGCPTSATAYLQLRFFRTDFPSNEGFSPIFTVTTGSFAFNSIVLHGPPSNSTWGDDPVWFGCLSCYPPWFLASPSNASVSLGSDVTLTAFATSYGGYVPRYQWRKEGVSITGATNASLNLTNVTLSDAGNYDVVASNNYGSTASAAATLTVFIPVIAATLGSPTFSALNQFQFTVTGTAGTNYIVQVSTNLATTAWLSLCTNASPFIYVETNANNFPQRFYRARY